MHASLGAVLSYLYSLWVISFPKKDIMRQRGCSASLSSLDTIGLHKLSCPDQQWILKTGLRFRRGSCGHGLNWLSMGPSSISEHFPHQPVWLSSGHKQPRVPLSVLLLSLSHLSGTRYRCCPAQASLQRPIIMQPKQRYLFPGPISECHIGLLSAVRDQPFRSLSPDLPEQSFNRSKCENSS